MNVSERGLAFVAAREAMSLTAYMDTTTLAAGFGQNDKTLKPGDTITQERAIEMFLEFADGLDKSLTIIFGNISIPQHQYDAIFSATYNIGPSWLRNGNQAFINAMKAVAHEPANREHREMAGAAFVLLTGPPATKGGKPRWPFNVARRCREALVYVSADYGDLSTLKMWPAGKSPRDFPVSPPDIVPMPRFVR